MIINVMTECDCRPVARATSSNKEMRSFYFIAITVSGILICRGNYFNSCRTLVGQRVNVQLFEVTSG